MKTPKIKVLIPMLLITGAGFTWAGIFKASEKKVYPEPETPTMVYIPDEETNFPKERNDIRADLVNFEQGKSDLYAWRQELKEDKKNSDGVTMEIVMDRKEIKKSKADIRHAKAYLKADKKDLKGDYKVELKEAKREKREAKRDLCEAKAQLRKDIRKENAVGVEANSEVVASLIRAHDAKLAYLEDVKSDYKIEWMAVNEEVKDSKRDAAEAQNYYTQK